MNKKQSIKFLLNRIKQIKTKEEKLKLKNNQKRIKDN